MRIIEWNLETSMQGADWSGEIEVDDDATDTQIDELVREEVFNIVSWGWTEKEKAPLGPGLARCR
jgi:hypothetical protein